jgi:nucleoside-diphosphate-sugar epimerase
MGPHVIRALVPHHRLRITDVAPPPAALRDEFRDHEFARVDVTDVRQVRDAAAGCEAIVNLAVVRRHPRLAFAVNAAGCQHVMDAAIKHNIRRVINTGPHFAVAGPSYEQFDFQITADAPPHPGTGLYALTKSLGMEICRAATRAHDIHVQTYLFYNLRSPEQLKPGRRGVPLITSWRDCGQAFRLGLAIPLDRLPSPFEVFFIAGDCPQGKFSNEKAKRILGFQPQDQVDILWRAPRKSEE